MNELKIIDQREVLGKDFKIYGDFENPLFLAKDVAEWIEHSNPTEMLKSIDENEKLNSTILSAGQRREMTFLTEDGLYEVLMLSRKPIAKEFKKQVKEILKTVRKTGMYITDNVYKAIISDPTKFGELLINYGKVRDENSKLKIKIEEQTPKVLFANAVATSHTSILVGELAKILKQNGVDIGANRLFWWLRENGYLISRNGTDWNMPTQKSMDLGLFEIKESTSVNPDGSVRVNKTPKVTGKGQQYFINKFLKNTKVKGA